MDESVVDCENYRILSRTATVKILEILQWMRCDGCSVMLLPTVRELVRSSFGVDVVKQVWNRTIWNKEEIASFWWLRFSLWPHDTTTAIGHAAEEKKEKKKTIVSSHAPSSCRHGCSNDGVEIRSATTTEYHRYRLDPHYPGHADGSV